MILSAGAIGSPHLLMLSGVGPVGRLDDVGVPVVHELPGVGKNLRDHPQVRMAWRTHDGFETPEDTPGVQITLRYTAEDSHLPNDMLILASSRTPIDYRPYRTGASDEIVSWNDHLHRPCGRMRAVCICETRTRISSRS